MNNTLTNGMKSLQELAAISMIATHEVELDDLVRFKCEDGNPWVQLEPAKQIILNHQHLWLRNEQYRYFMVSSSLVLLSELPKEYITPYLCKIAVASEPHFLSMVPFGMQDQKMCEDAVRSVPRMIEYVREDLVTYSMLYNAVAIGFNAVPYNFLTPELCERAVRYDPWMFYEFPEEFQTYDLCRAALQKDWMTFDQMPPYFLDDEMIEAMLESSGIALQVVPSRRRTDRMIRIALESNPRALRYILQPTEEMIIEAVSRDPTLFRMIEHPTPAICEATVRNNSVTLGFIPREFITQRLCDIAVENCPSNLAFVPEEFKSYGMCMDAVRKDDSSFTNVPDVFKTPDLIREAYMHEHSVPLGALPNMPYNLLLEIVSKHGGLILGIQSPNKELLMAAIRSCPHLIERFNTTDRTLITAAVETDGRVIESLKGLIDQELCDIAIRSNPDALYSVPEEFKSYKMCMSSVSRSGKMIRYVPPKFKTYDMYLAASSTLSIEDNLIPGEYLDERMYTSIIRTHGDDLSLVPWRFRTKEMCMLALRSNIEAWRYIPPELRNECGC